MKGAVAQLSRDTSTPSRNAAALPSRRPSAPINLGNALQDVSRQRRAVRRAYSMYACLLSVIYSQHFLSSLGSAPISYDIHMFGGGSQFIFVGDG